MLLLENPQKRIIQSGYDLPYKDYTRGFYSDSETEDEEYHNTPITSVCGKSSPPINTDVFKIDAILFYQALLHCIPASLGFNEIDGRDKGCMCPSSMSDMRR